MSHDPHFGSVLAAYALALAVIAAMIAAVVLDHRRLKRALSKIAAGAQKQPGAEPRSQADQEGLD